MKKTFKGYSALIALLIALLVVTAMPMVGFAAEEDTQIVQVGTEKHVVSTTPSRVYSEPTCGTDGLKEYTCLGILDEDGNITRACGNGGKHVIADTNRPAHTEYVKSQTGSDCTTGGEVEIWCKVCNQFIRTEKIEKADHTFLYNDLYTYNLDKDGNQITGKTYAAVEYANCRYWNTDMTWEQAMKYEQLFIDEFNEDYNAEIVLPTCQKEGSVTFKCTVCGASETYKLEKNANMHTLSDWQPLKGAEATCTKAGVEVRYCIDPGHGDHAPIFSRDADALGHDWKYLKVKDYEGCIPKTISIVCSRCGETKDITYAEVGTGDYAKISKSRIETKHSFKEIKKNFVEEVAALDLKSKNWKFDGTGDNAKVVPANCAEDAVFVFKCDKWDANHTADDVNAYKVVERAASDHSYGAWTTVTAATDTKEGFYTRKCTVCGHAQNKTGWLVDGKVVDKNGNETAPLAIALDLSEVKEGEGTATVEVTSGSLAADAKLYARVAWFYETNDGLTYGFVAIKNVDVADDGAMTVDVSGPNPGDGFNFTGVQVVITTDKDAHKTAAYADKALAMEKA